MAITTIKIFPTIGVARIGNSPEFFIGPELPGVRTPPPGGYKDAHCRIKRQAARFRLYAFDENDQLIIENGQPKEITMADATITWTVELANTKASWKKFNGLDANASLRNAGVADRSTLEIKPGPRLLDGPNQAAGFNTGTFLGKAVALGEMRTEATGRLLVIGGFGDSESVPPGEAIVTYANNDKWHDDVSDGPVTATVMLNGSNVMLPVKPAWVICPPPDFAPPIDSVTTLYDVLLQVASDKGLLTVPAKSSFSNDIYPILSRVLNIQRVNQLAASGHFSFPSAFPLGADNGARQGILSRLRNPNNPNGPLQADMPRIYDDSEDTFQTVTKLQYKTMQNWAGVEGTTWINDWTGSPPPPPTEITPDGLTRAALEACVGGAFFPGIEASWFLRDTYSYTEPFRLDHAGRVAGDVTKQMAVPWQADFFKCYAYTGGNGQLYAWWPAQRPDDVFPETGGGPVPWIRNIVGTHEDMVNYWHKLGFIVDKGGNLIETERRVVCTNIFLIIDHNSFSEDEVSSALTGGSPAIFEDALYVVAEGFVPADLGVTKANPTPGELAPIAPAIAITRNGNVAVPGMKATAQKLLLEDNSLPPNLRQRFTFVYQIEFANTDGFSLNGNPVESQVVEVKATKDALSTTFTSLGEITLFHQPNPYMLDGPVSWLSNDLRVFQVTEGDKPFNNLIGAIGSDQAAALSFIDKLVTKFNTLGPVNHPFTGISTNQKTSKLELSEKVNNKRVFNFAVARVHYRGNVLPADNVKVFFRLFTTAATGLAYDKDSTYRRTPSSTDPISLLGLQGGQVVTIPCFGRARVDSSAAALDTQVDDLNVHNFQPSGGNEAFAYFGCWLDFNQTAPQFPRQPVPKDGKWTVGRESIQNLIRGLHQCLVAEIYFKDDPINGGDSPASSDNLAQRNLAIVESDNPGSPDTHIVQHTFEIKATRPKPRSVVVTNTAGAPVAATSTTTLVEPGPDELMVRWNNLPPTTRVTLYMPSVDVDEVLRIAGQSYEAIRLERVDDHTLLCLPGDVTYVPIPPGHTKNIAALITFELPENVTRREAFQVVIHQISGFPRRVLGAFQISIPVSDKTVLLEPEKRYLSVLRSIARAIPPDDQWHPVFKRYLDQMAGRVRGFGGDPDEILPAPDGSGRDVAAERCARRGWLFSILLALLVLVAALNPLPIYLAEIVFCVAAIIAVVSWCQKCRPSVCRTLFAALVGLVFGAAVLAILLLLGQSGQRGLIVLALAALALGGLVLWGVWSRCFTLTEK